MGNMGGELQFSTEIDIPLLSPQTPDRDTKCQLCCSDYEPTTSVVKWVDLTDLPAAIAGHLAVKGACGAGNAPPAIRV